MKERMRALSSLWKQLHARTDHARCEAKFLADDKARKELWRPVMSPEVAIDPPRYEEAVAHLPPDYTTACATANLALGAKDGPRNTTADIDWSRLDNIRTYAKKKAKQAAKQAQKDKWADSGDEGENAPPAGGGDDGAGGDGGDGGAGAGGDGGDPPGGGDGGGGDDEDWFGGGKKSKKDKKKKKNIWDLDEDEEAKKADEPAAGGEDPAAAAGEADPVDEWASFAPAGKK